MELKIDVRQKELNNCNFVKTILMIIIVFYHSILFWKGTWFNQAPIYSSKILAVLSTWLNTFHIYAFTLVSGYIYYYIRYEKGKYNKFLPFLINKTKRLLIPYIFVATFWVIPVSTIFYNYDINTVIDKFVLAMSPGQLWFLVMIFDVFIISWILSDIFKKKNLLGLIIAIVFYGIGTDGRHIIPNVFAIWTACGYIIFFWLGFKIRQCGSEKIRKIPIIVWLLIDILLFMVTQYISKFDSELKLVLNFLLYIIGAIMAFVILQKVAETINWERNKVITFLSKHTMPIYLFHMQIIYFFIDWLNGVVNPYINATINFVVSLSVSILISLVLKKVRITKFLIGEK